MVHSGLRSLFQIKRSDKLFRSFSSSTITSLKLILRRSPSSSFTFLSRSFCIPAKSAPESSQHHDSSQPRLTKQAKENRIDRIARIGAACNISLAILKATAGYLCASSGLLASAVDSCSDVFGDGILLWALKVARQPPNQTNPWGYGRIETIASLGIGSIMVGAGACIGWSSLNKLYQNYHPSIAKPLLATQLELDLVNSEWLFVGIVTAALAVLAKEVLFRLTLKIAKEVGGSRVLIAHAHHHRADSYTSLGALLGLLGSLGGFPVADLVAGAFVSAIITKSGLGIAKQSLSELTDVGLKTGELDQMVETVRKVSGVLDVCNQRARRLGPFVEFQATVLIDPWLSLSHAHDLAAECSRILMKKHERVQFSLINPAPKRLKTRDYQSQLDISSDKQDHFLSTELDHFSKKSNWDSSHHMRRIETDLKLRHDVQSVPGVKKINRILLHRLHKDSDKWMNGYIATVTIECDPHLSVTDAQQIAKLIQQKAEAVTLSDGSRAVMECDVHLDLTEIPSEKESLYH